jgi:hypothetical protein
MKMKMKSVMKLLSVLVVMGAALTMGAEAAEDGPYRHVVLFQFKESASAEDVAAIEVAFGELKGKIDTIEDYEWGTNVSPEGLNDGLTHCFLVTFKDKAGLEVYLPHQAHKDFVAMLKPHLEKAVVLDYVAE